MFTGSQPELPLFDPTEPRILPQDGMAWFTINRMTDDGKMTQRPYRLHLIETVLRAIGRATDTYMSQGMFALPCRRAVHLAWLTYGYVDLDTYRVPEWHGLSSDDLVREILWMCGDDDIPPPSAILSSGRGVYCKWFWSQPAARAEAGRAVAVNRALARRLVRFGADLCAVDVSRILRVVGTINGKSKRPVSIVWLNGSSGVPTIYDFDAFASRILPASIATEPECDPHDRAGREEPHPPIISKKRGGRAFNREHWHWGVLEDIRALAAARYPSGIVEPGMRDLYGHLAACQIARVIRPRTLFHEIVAIARVFLPAGYVDGEFRAHCSSLLDRAKGAAEGQHERTPIYTYSKARMMDLLQVTPDEERFMTRLIANAEKYRRKVLARRTAGVMARADYEATAAARQARARMLRGGGFPWAEVARRMGLPSPDAARQLALRCPGG